MIIYLVRHADAGNRLHGYQDRFRSLTPDGKRQAEAIGTFLAASGVDSIIASPAVRCQQTVEPLATKLSLPRVESDVLWEDSFPVDVIDLMNQSVAETSVFCSHGNIIPSVLQILRQSGAQAGYGGIAKGSIWAVSGEPNNWRTANYTSADELG